MFLRYHRKNCCRYGVLKEVLVRGNDLKNYSGFLSRNPNQTINAQVGAFWSSGRNILFEKEST